MSYKTRSPTQSSQRVGQSAKASHPDYSACELYEFNHNNNYVYAENDCPYFYEYVIEIIELINQDARFINAVFQDEYTLYDMDEANNMKHKYTDDAVSKLEYEECDKFICEIGLQKSLNLYDNSGYEDISMRQLRNIKGIRKLLLGIIMFCISVKDEVEETEDEDESEADE
jgi:hypothetical protein